MNVSVKPYWDLLAAYLRPLWPKVALLAGLLFVGIALQLVNPQIIRYFIDTARSGGSQSALLLAAVVFIVSALVQQVVSLAGTYVSEDVGWAATNHLRADLMLHCLRLDMPFHKTYPPGVLIERIDGDITNLANFFSQLVLRVLGNLLLALGILLLLFRENWRFGLVGLVYTTLLLLFLRAVQNPASRVWGAAREASANLFGFLEERLVSTEDIRASSAEAYVMRRLYALMRDLLHKERKASVMGSFTFVAGWGIYVLSSIAALALGAVLFLQGRLTIGSVFLVTYYMGSLEGPLNEIRRQVTDLQRAGASIRRIHEILDIQEQVVDSPQMAGVAPALTPGAPPVTFEHVSFAYEGRDSVLHDVSFHLAAGHILGLLGRTGSGKTTITRLLFRLYDPVAGAICLNGTDIRDVPLAELRRHVGMVTQDVQLFAATVRDNLTFFNQRVPDERILAVLGELGLWEWYEQLPAGLDTRLESGGKGLSAGEAQLLAFTRVFLRDPGLVILDEASSRLDPATERLIERAIGRLLRNRTGIIIAHRLDTVQRADDILILDGGRIQEQGSRVVLANDPQSRFYSLLQTGLEEALA